MMVVVVIAASLVLVLCSVVVVWSSPFCICGGVISSWRAIVC